MTTTKEHPILFSGEMVRAILDGRKTQTRRVIKFPKHTYTPDASWVASVNPDGKDGWIAWGPHGTTDEDSRKAYPNGGGFRCPYGVPGDLLWVRETWQGLVRVYDEDLPWSHVAVMHKRRENVVEIGYKADYPNPIDDGGWAVWVPSIHMPRWASRITLRVVDVRVERLQEITPSGYRNEGIDLNYDAKMNSLNIEPMFKQRWISLWDSINAARGFGWDANPWVWVVEFEKVQS